MKKFAIVALIAALTSCGGNEEKTPAKTDSTTVKTDSTKTTESTKKAPVATEKKDTVK